MLRSRFLSIVETAAAAAAVIVAAVSAQAPAGSTFEAASVKPHRGDEQQMSMVAEPGGRLVAINIPLPFFIRTAYRLQDDQLVGGPAWLNSERFDIVAKADPGATLQQLPAMMQDLLADRFKLVTHHEMRELSAYALVLARTDGTLGPQLRPTACPSGPSADSLRSSTLATVDLSPACATVKTGTGTLTLRGAPMSQVVQFLAPYVSRVLLDRTGLTGRIDLDLTWTPEQRAAPAPGATTNSDGPSIFTALQEQLGLKLEATKDQVDVLVIDSVEHPTED